MFNALDGKGQIARAHYSELANALKESRTNAGETPLFSFRAHKNRNIHLAFKRLDLVAQINKRAGERGLRPSTARAA